MRTWLKSKLGNIAGGIVSGLILSLPAIALALVLLAAGPVGWGVLAALIIVGVGLGIHSRFAEYRADHHGQGPGWGAGIALVTLGALDITGIPYIVEASTGQRAFAPQPMTTFERWERGTQGVVNLVLMLAGGGKKLLAGEARPVVPVDPNAPGLGEPHPVVDPNVPVDPNAPAIDPADPNAPARPRSCFLTGTLVATPNGLRAIESLIPGDKVLTVEPADGRISSHPVTSILTAHVQLVLCVQISETTIFVSPEHPFWDFDRGWVVAAGLRVGTGLLSANGKPAYVTAVAPRPGRYTVHNLTVGGAHTYLVSPISVLVHNKGAAADPVGALRGYADSLAERVRTAQRTAQAQAPDTPGRSQQIEQLRDIQKAIDQLQKESNAPDPDVDDLEEWAQSIDKQRLEPIEQQLPEPETVEPVATHELTADDAFRTLQTRRLWVEITGENPNRSWTAELHEDMPSDTPHQAKVKMMLTGRSGSQPPVRVEVSVIYDRTTGTFEDMHTSGGKSKRQ